MRVLGGLAAGIVIAAAAVPALALQTVPLTAAQKAATSRNPDVSGQAASSAAPEGGKAGCGPDAITSAVRHKVAPAVVGCDFTVVAKRLLDVKILAVPSKTDSDLAANTIVTQSPEAGAPLTDGFMSMRVSRGPAAAASSATASSAVSSAQSSGAVSSVTPPSSAPPVEDGASSVAPEPQSSAAVENSAVDAPLPAGVPKPASPPAPDGPDLHDIVSILWSAIAAWPLPAAIVAVVALLLTLLGLRGRRPRLKAGTAPRVRCELTPGPARLVLSGPLVLGRREDA